MEFMAGDIGFEASRFLKEEAPLLCRLSYSGPAAEGWFRLAAVLAVI